MRYQTMTEARSNPLPVYRSEPHPCAYLPDRQAAELFFVADQLDPRSYEHLMNQRFRRTGIVFYRPDCDGCEACVPIRVPVAEFQPSRSQRRVLARNANVRIAISPPTCDTQRLELLNEYERRVHAKPAAKSEAEYQEHFCGSPLTTIEMTYWLDDRLIGVGLIDETPNTLSSVYFYYDPAEARRSLGVFSALREIEECRRRGRRWWYLGFYVGGCRKMAYKATFGPHELLVDGRWEVQGVAS